MSIPNILFNNLIELQSAGNNKKNELPPQVIILKNGLKLVYEQVLSNIPLTSIQCFINLGSIYETQGIQGISHIIEHMVFKGTKKLPKAIDVSKYFDKSGAYLNAYTEKEITCYVIKCQNDYIHLCLNVLADMLFNSIIEKNEFDKEYQVVLEEARMSLNDSDNTVYEEISKMLYKGTSYENPVDHLDYHKNLIKYEKIIEIYKKYYIPQNMVLSIVSTIPFKTIFNFIKKTDFFKKKSKFNILGENVLCKPYTEFHNNVEINNLGVNRNSNTNIIIQKKRDLEITFLAFGFRTCNFFSNEKYILNLLKFVLTGPIISRFFRILREENGLTYNTNISINNYECYGDFTVFTQVNPHKIIKNGKKKGLIPIISDIFKDLYINGITTEEFNIANGYLKGILTRNSENNDVLAEHNGEHVLYWNNKKQKNDIFSYLKKYETCYSKITQKDIHNIIQKYFINENVYIFILGSIVPTEKVIRKNFNINENIG